VNRPVAALAMQPELPNRLFNAAARERLQGTADIDTGILLTRFDTPQARDVLARVEVLLTGWMCPLLDEAVLAEAPRLRAILHAGGSVKAHVSQAAWDRGLLVSTAVTANALPVAEYTLAAILMAGKAIPWIERTYRDRQDAVKLLTEYPTIGNYDRRVGIVGASRIGRRVLDLLRPFDLDVVVYDPYLSPDDAAALGTRSVTLEELIGTSQIISVHAPATPATFHMLDRRLLHLIPDGATLINTSRGSLIDQDALVKELQSGRISAILDVTDPEVLPPGHPLYTLPNVVLTPHLAGSIGTELHRLGDLVVAELERYAQGRPLEHLVPHDVIEHIA
jgi:phosphoglycerate dehydrogenase-like enzyme